MKTVTKKTHPITKGWLHATFTLNSKEIISDKTKSYLKGLCTGREPEKYEFEQFEQNGNKVKIVYRSLEDKAKHETVSA